MASDKHFLYINKLMTDFENRSRVPSKDEAKRDLLRLESELRNNPQIPGAATLLREQSARCLTPKSYSTILIAPAFLNDEDPYTAVMSEEYPMIPSENPPVDQEEWETLHVPPPPPDDLDYRNGESRHRPAGYSIFGALSALKANAEATIEALQLAWMWSI
eukprot:jgi/Hompol1/6294/HPOL_002205-RA